MKKLDFVYKRTSKIIVPLDSLSFIAARARYFATIDELRNNGTKIFWHDETWCNKNEEKRFVWTDGMTGSGRLRNAEGKGKFFIIKCIITFSIIGKRVVISALISNSGFHLPSIDIFECDEDHSMDSKHFVMWVDRTSSLLRKQLGNIPLILHFPFSYQGISV